MTDLYQLVTVDGGKEDSNAILAILKEIHGERLQNDLRLLNYYHEIPVSYPATVESIEDDMVDVLVHQHQAVVMYHQKMTFLKSRHFPHDVVAGVFRADVNRCVAVLSRFAYAHVRAERRQFLRVRIEGDTQVTFRSAAGAVTGVLSDISVRGISMSASAADLQPPVNGTISLVLEGTPLSFPATFLKSIESSEGPRYIFEMDATSKDEEKISQFIIRRQLEIIRGLKDSL
ncbi:PilZ domain-containing protein [Geobacter sp. DSM 9736]|uniref:PilZ domain-containing protein n=1 Tax=Geobacter sp. DSM 9736 TaxID=1277350 RepID=UPI000B50FBDE|nr:PilZ domain-containing protein [Geobacter sp. DSM 9736]SNB47619.1 PilZ domain-containing protein [Geobacter sp. DSM 9736]